MKTKEFNKKAVEILNQYNFNKLDTINHYLDDKKSIMVILDDDDENSTVYAIFIHTEIKEYYSELNNEYFYMGTKRNILEFDPIKALSYFQSFLDGYFNGAF